MQVIKNVDVTVIRNKNSLLKKIKRYMPLFVMMSPTLLYVFLFSYVPMFGVIIAFKNVNYTQGIFGSPWVGFKNFEFLFKTQDAWIITRNTVGYNIIFISTGLIASVTIAILLNELLSKRLARLYQAIIILPYFLSAIVLSFILYSLLSTDAGFLNRTILPFLGMKPIQWYFDIRPWPFIFPLVNLWKTAGYSSIIYLAAILGIDPEYYEAASLDGATKLQQIRHITLPFIKPIMVMLTILAIGGMFKADFGLFFNLPMESGTLFPVTNVIDTYVYRALLQLGNTGMAAAAGLYQSFVGFVLILITNTIVRKVDNDSALF